MSASLGEGGEAPEPCAPGLDPDTLDPGIEAVAPPPRRKLPIIGRIDGAAPGLAVGGTQQAQRIKDGRLATGRLAGLSMNKAIVLLSWPVLIESLLTSTVGLTDTLLAAGLDHGVAATDAIGAASYITWFIALIVMSLGVGATALVSRSIGKGRHAVANAATAQTLLLGVVIGVVTGAGVWLLARPVAWALTLGPLATGQFITYIVVLTWAVPFMGILYGGNACARGAGDTFRPLMVMGIVNVVNMGLSWALAGVDLTSSHVVDGEVVTNVLLSNPFPFDLGVLGIAIGTLVANIVGAMCVVAILWRGSPGVRLTARRLRPHWHTIRRLVRVGLPNFFETFGLWIGNFMVILMVGWLGAAGESGLLGAHIVAIRIEAFSFLPGFAMGIAAATLAGQFLGAGSAALARRAVWRCAIIAALLMGAIGLLFIVVPRPIVGLFSPQPLHLAVVPHLIVIAGAVQIPFALAIVTRSAMRGAGDVRTVMVLTWITTYGVRLPLAYALSGVRIPLGNGEFLANPFGLEPSLTGIWLALCIELVVRGIVFLTRFVQGGWTRARV